MQYTVHSDQTLEPAILLSSICSKEILRIIQGCLRGFTAALPAAVEVEGHSGVHFWEAGD
jgi:hypothetical protein